ncbi:MAG: FAD-binding oxidoreductase [Proteobacteria bacterium]|nr:FAD-binding oxidoreductase [Pseudomonadota bacterium]
MRHVSRAVSGWGNYPVAQCDVYRPETRADLAEIVARAPQSSLIARGLGRSYGDAALNAGHAVIQSDRLDRLLSFDPEGGVLACEAAVSLAEILDVFLPRGFFFPVTPGTKFITVGGAIAADVHGKNHHRSGSMAASLLDFQLLTARGDVLTCSREENADLFWATLGGMGLTGVILEARLQLRPVDTAAMVVDQEKARDLDAVLERCAESDDDYDYSVSWIDCLARGRSLGRSILLRANHAALEDLPASARAEPYAPQRRLQLSVPFTLPSFTLNPVSVRAFNTGIYHVHRSGRTVRDCDGYFYPLDRVHHWNRIYGRRGMLQYQCALPHESARQGLVEVLEELSSTRRASFLAVLKSFGAASEGVLSFPRPGFTLALDLPYTGPDALAALARLDRIVARHGGNVYLAKDACLDPQLFRDMYPGLERFREIKDKVDPEHRFSSSQARRLGLAEAP